MAPTESKILSNYLLVPAQLPAIISLQEFIALFPRSMQSSSQIRSLYRDLQSQRNALVDAVSADIETETKRGRAQRRAFIKEKRNAESQEYDDEVEIERMLFGVEAKQAPKHTINSIIPDLERAVGEVEGELQRLEAEQAALMASVQQTVGGMSDLRYGRLANTNLPEQVLDGLADLEQTCKSRN